jgi:hypothetical protein
MEDELTDESMLVSSDGDDCGDNDLSEDPVSELPRARSGPKTLDGTISAKRPR